MLRHYTEREETETETVLLWCSFSYLLKAQAASPQRRLRINIKQGLCPKPAQSDHLDRPHAYSNRMLGRELVTLMMAHVEK